MQTKRIPIHSILEDHEQVEEAAGLLRQGGVVAIPTETVYGLAANAYDGAAVAKIFVAKGRPMDNPLIVHISEFDMLPDLVEDTPEAAMELARRYWPGPLTIILKKSDRIPDEVSAGLPTVAVRMPSNTVARGIIGACGFPLAAPSANLSGSPSPTTADHVLHDLDGRVEGIVISDDAAVGLESTVVSLAGLAEGERPRLLRPGAVTPEMLRDALGEIDIDPAVLHQLEEGRKAPSPGMKYKHYAPKARVILVEGDRAAYIEYANRHAKEGACALCFEEDADGLQIPTVTYGRADAPDSEAHALFDALRRLDEEGYTTAYAHAPGKDGVGLAVYNRLIRAAAFQVVQL